MFHFVYLFIYPFTHLFIYLLFPLWADVFSKGFQQINSQKSQ